MKYQYPTRFATYGLTVAVLMTSSYWCLANWHDKDTRGMEFLLGSLIGLLTGILIPTRIDSNPR